MPLNPFFRDSIQSYVRTSMNHKGNCLSLFDEKTWLSALLLKVKAALKLGCSYDSMEKGHPEEKTLDICNNLPRYLILIAFVCEYMSHTIFSSDTLLEEIEVKFIEELDKCTQSFAHEFIGRWISTNVRAGGLDDTSEKIKTMLDEKFQQFHYVVVTYPACSGFSNHCTNFDIIKFRHHDKNIVVDLTDPIEHQDCQLVDTIQSKLQQLLNTLGFKSSRKRLTTLHSNAQAFYNFMVSGYLKRLVIHTNHYSVRGNSYCTLRSWYRDMDGIFRSQRHHDITAIFW